MTIWYLFSPCLRLNGNWLAEARFSTDTPVIISVEQGRLVIEPVKGCRVKDPGAEAGIFSSHHFV
ncbi:type I toxin-antitoxin system SymE family toxin [Leclercia sp. W6]|uniref:SymE family type I addiction module toxin n=1 Tax=Leclercia sp. W6 TaxID=2282310 RepID=UPI000DF24DCB|nr:SymE family type I addiction module toxin [Leclercia sp. W6]AXF61877.1 type I toxin-antitoxin system SymE family toxin [Leclercia sp. W6]